MLFMTSKKANRGIDSIWYLFGAPQNSCIEDYGVGICNHSYLSKGEGMNWELRMVAVYLFSTHMIVNTFISDVKI